MKPFLSIFSGLIIFLAFPHIAAGEAEVPSFSTNQRMVLEPVKEDKAPSKQAVQWMGPKSSYEFRVDYDYVASAPSDLGGGVQGDVEGHLWELRSVYAQRFIRAFLLHAGVEWRRHSYTAPGGSLHPTSLQALNGFTALDFRFSRKDMIRIQTRPGFFGDVDDLDGDDLNVPFDVAYTRVFSHDLQMFVGISVNTLREIPVLPGAGFRWKINDKWKIKFILPKPTLEYRAREDLHLFVIGEYIGDTFRMGGDFGTRRGRPELDNALVDTQEIRVGGGFSWNIKPLVELNVVGGYMLDRHFQFHNNNLGLNSGGAPYVRFELTHFFSLPDQFWNPDTWSGRFQVPVLRRLSIVN